MNVLIVEDESHTASLLQEIIEEDQDFIVIQTVETIVEAVQYLGKYQKNLDLLFFDIQLADGKSFEIFKHVDVTVPIIFCTAYDEYTLQAIKNNGIDYVLKPFKEEEIHQALQKYKQLISNIQKKNPSPIYINTEPSPKYQKTFLAQYRDKSVVKKADEIALFQVEHDTVYLYTLSGERLPLYKTMEYLESVCDPEQFFRVNRQALVGRKSITAFEPYFHRKIALKLSIETTEPIIVSRLKVSAFKDWLER